MNPRIPILAAALALCGCTSAREVPRSDLRRAGAYEKVRVATLDGFEYNFTRIAVRADTLTGYYVVTEERTGPKQEVWYEDTMRRHDIPLARVAKVELVRTDPVRTAFYGASIAAAGYFLVTLVQENPRRGGGSGGGGKPPINP